MKIKISALFVLFSLLYTTPNHAFDLSEMKAKAKNKIASIKNYFSKKKELKLSDEEILASEEDRTAALPEKKKTIKEKLLEKKKALSSSLEAFKEKRIIASLGSAAKKYTNNNYPYAETVATVRTSDGLAREEKTCLEKRLTVVEKNLSKLFNGIEIPHDAVPRIAICGSGGGYRAMIATNGSMAGAEEFGLLDVTSYLAGVSGSTWAISGFMQSNMTAKEYVKQLSTRLEKSLIHKVNKKHHKEALLRKMVAHQSFGFIDAYGNLVAQKVLTGLDGKNNVNDFFIYNCSPRVFKGKLPIPLYTSVLVHNGNYVGWMEHTPFEIGSRDALKSFVPAWAFGRTFEKGASINNPAPLPLSLGMGIWGSAMTASVKDALDDIKKSQSSSNQNRIEAFLHSKKTTGIQEARIISPAQVPNWNYDLDNALLNDQKDLLMVDAGLSINIPTPPFLGPDRAIDIIIVLDNGESACATDNDEDEENTENKKPAEGGNQLKHTNEYAQRYGYKFPPIDYSKTKDIVSVHVDEQDPICPIVIYLPLTKNKNYKNGWNPSPKIKGAYTPTSNFAYTEAQVKELSGLTKLNMSQSKHEILKAIAFKINQKVPGTIPVKIKD